MSSSEVGGSRVRKAVVPVAGWGTRMFPASYAVPKALFPLVEEDGVCRTVLQSILREAMRAGADSLCVVLAPYQRAAIEHFFFDPPPSGVYAKERVEELEEIGRRLTLVEQTSAEGYGHAVLCAREFVGNDPFFVFLGDHVYITSNTRSCAQQLCDAFDGTNPVTSLAFCSPDNVHTNGLVRGRLEENGVELLESLEKPTLEEVERRADAWEFPEEGAGKFLCYFGIEVFTKEVMEALEYLKENNIRRHGELQLRDAMGLLMRKEQLSRTEEEDAKSWSKNICFRGVIVEGERLDTGLPKAYAKTVALKANVQL